MYSAPDFVKISIQQTNAFASVGVCDPEWSESKTSLEADCKRVTMYENLEWQCWVFKDPPT